MAVPRYAGAPSEHLQTRSVVSIKHVPPGDGWDLCSLSVDRPPIEPSQYVSVPPKRPDKMGFDEVRNLFCCHRFPIHYVLLVAELPDVFLGV